MAYIKTRVWSIEELKDQREVGDKDAKKFATKLIEKIVEKNAEPSWNDGWYEDTLNALRDDLKTLGVEDPEINFSGFWSQGDGASFTGKWSLVELLDHLKTPRPDDDSKDLFHVASRIVRDGVNVEQLTRIVEHVHGYGDECYAGDPVDLLLKRNSSHYSHENTVSIELDSWEEAFDCAPSSSPAEVIAEQTQLGLLLGEFEKSMDIVRKNLCRHIYQLLEKEYTYRTSEAGVLESVEDRYFDANGDGWSDEYVYKEEDDHV